MTDMFSPSGQASTPQRRASDVYKNSNFQGKSERELMAELYRKVIGEMHLAREAYLRKAFDEMVHYNARNIHVIDVLREELAASEALNDPEAMPPARFLLKAYRDTIVRLTNILTTPSPQEEFTALIDLMTQIYRAWTPPTNRAEDAGRVEAMNINSVG